MKNLKQFTVKALLVLAAISGFGIGCIAQQPADDTVVTDNTVVPKPVEELSQPTVEVVSDNTLRYFLGDGAFGFELSKGWPVKSQTQNEVVFHRTNEHGFSSLTVTAQEGRTPEQFINDSFPNGEYTGKVYDGLMHGQNGRYLTANAGAGSMGVFAQMLSGKLVTVAYATNSEGVSELGFREVIASLKTMETE